MPTLICSHCWIVWNYSPIQSKQRNHLMECSASLVKDGSNSQSQINQMERCYVIRVVKIHSCKGEVHVNQSGI